MDTAGMDRGVKPGDSFYGFANGTWAKQTEIPADRSSYGMFARLSELAAQRTRALVEAAAAGQAAAGSPERKVGDAYASFMDEAAIEAKGLAPLQPELARIAALSTRRQLSALLGAGLRADVNALNTGDVSTDRLFGLWVTDDIHRPGRYAGYLLQGGLGLPDRDYYLVDSPRYVEVRGKYRAHVERMLQLAGLSEPAARAARVLALETKLAREHWDQLRTQKMDEEHPSWALADFARKAPGMDWGAYFEAAGLAGQPALVAWQPGAVTGLSRLVAAEPLEAWRDYLAFRAVARAAPVLPKAFVEESFSFNGRVLSGAQAQRERWKRGVDFATTLLGEAVGELYVQRHFPPEAKAAADAMVRHIVAAMDARIDGLAWMAPSTKAKAKEKLSTLKVGIGHAERPRDFSGLEVRRDDAYGNLERAHLFEYRQEVAQLGAPVADRVEWDMVPHLVNAMNSPHGNYILFPAAILQPPFFDPQADPAVNYGGIGSVIGHEIVHSFDDTGAQFDASGKLTNWWQPEDLARFRAAGKALAAQYSAYAPLPDARVNGELTLGENIADVAGVAIALDGWRRSLGGAPAPALEGFSGEQRFFLGFAQVWRTKYREPALRRTLLTDPHAPGEFRAATVRNQDAWYEAFGVQPGEALFLAPEQRVRVW
jgi:putative endopeptidase